MKSCLAFDPGTVTTGWAYLEILGGEYIFRGGGVVNVDYATIVGLLASSGPTVAVESFTYQGPMRSGKNVLIAADSGGYIRGIAAGYGVVNVYKVPAPTWRKDLLGKTNPKDVEVYAYVQVNVKSFPTNLKAKDRTHVVDSAALALHTLRGYSAV